MESLSIAVKFLQSELQASTSAMRSSALIDLPFSNNLVKVPATLLGDHGGGVGALVSYSMASLSSSVSVHERLGLLGGGNLGVEALLLTSSAS